MVGEAEVAAVAEIRLVHVIGHRLREFISVFFLFPLSLHTVLHGTLNLLIAARRYRLNGLISVNFSFNNILFSHRRWSLEKEINMVYKKKRIR